MIGVVLWSDPRQGTAVIWCEDHGDLAFYRNGSATDEISSGLDAGDLVSFDVHTVRNLRFASNAEVVEGGIYRDLPEALKTEPSGAMQAAIAADHAQPSANVVPLFAGVHGAREKLRDLIARTG